MVTQIKDKIYWVGHVDWTMRDFHSYVTDKGVTYNSYLIDDSKTALVDGVKAPFLGELLKNIKSVIGERKLDYIVCNHAEPDHSGAIPGVVKATGATVVCDEKCRGILSGYYDTSSWDFNIVKTGDVLDLGARKLHFIETPMVHWPDSLFTYLPDDKLLFSMDGFGQHYASSARFDDEVPLCDVLEEARVYYANIVMPYGKQVQKVLEAAADLEIEMIAPSHGIIWRSHVAEIVEAYKGWCVCKPKPKVSVIYDSMWESTAMMAQAIYTGACAKGVEVKLLRVRSVGNTKVMADMLDSACIAVGSATLNQGVMPAMASALTYLRGLRPVGKVGFAFGSSGWGRGGPEEVNEYLEKMKFDIVCEPLKSKWRPDAQVLAECEKMGAELAAKALELSK